MIKLSDAEYFNESNSTVGYIGEEEVSAVRDFINKLINLKKQVEELVYQNELSGLELPKKNIDRYHSLDIELSVYRILTFNYLP